MTNASTEHDLTPGSSDHDDSSTAEHAKSQARDVAETGQEQAGKVVQEAKAQTSQFLDEARTRARDRADTQTSQLAGVLERVSSELGEMAEGTSSSDGYLAALARDGSSTARDLSQRLQDGGLDGALDDVRQFARRRPVAFLAATFGVGLLLGRVTRNADLQKIASDDGPSRASAGPSTNRPSSGQSPDSSTPISASTNAGSTTSRPPSSSDSAAGGVSSQPLIPGEPDLMAPTDPATRTAELP